MTRSHLFGGKIAEVRSVVPSFDFEDDSDSERD